MQQVLADEFEGFGPTFDDESENKLGDSVINAAMKILEHPELHNPQLRKRQKVKVVSKTYDLSDDKSRGQYESDCAALLNSEPGTRLLVEHPQKQFVQIGDTYKYIAYMEWLEYLPEEPEDQKQDKNDK